MFTGLVEDVGTVAAVERAGGGVRLRIATSLSGDGLSRGASVAVSGACLTVVEPGDGTFAADVSPETLSVTTLKGLKKGARVNLERALSAGGRLGGHFVLGHVDGVCRTASVSPQGGFTALAFSAAAEVLKYIVPKGSIAIDGVSLTVNAVREASFEVLIIPHTLKATTLGGLRPGSEVNVECDVLGKYVFALLGRRAEKKGLSMEDLARAGFLD
jgi:riboflavin synthase